MRRETEGNPFFVREICSHVHEIGAASTGRRLHARVARRARRREAGDRTAGRAASRSRRPRAQRAAAVIGREFDLDLLIEITGDDEDDLLDLLDEAVAARVVEETQHPGPVLVRARLDDA